MPTLIELSPEESERLGVSQLFEVPAPINGERHPEFIRRPGEEWDWNGNHNDVSTGAHKESGSYRFATRATPSEIAAQAPSVGRDELVGVLVAACEEALTCIATTTPMGSDKIDDPAVRTAVEAQCEYMDRVRKTLRAALAAAGKGE